MRSRCGASEAISPEQQRGGQVDDAAGYRVHRRRVLALPHRDRKPHHQIDEKFVEASQFVGNVVGDIVGEHFLATHTQQQRR